MLFVIDDEDGWLDGIHEFYRRGKCANYSHSNAPNYKRAEVSGLLVRFVIRLMRLIEGKLGA